MTRPALSLIDLAALALLYFAVLRRKWRRLPRDRRAVRLLMFLYLCLLAYVTVMPVLASLPLLFNHPYVPMQMIPFDDYLHGRGDTVRQIVLNVVMTMPFGFLLPILRRTKLLPTVLCTALLSAAIELVQPLLYGARSSDITDLITNTLGGLIGYLLYLLCRPLVRRALLRLRRGGAE